MTHVAGCMSVCIWRQVLVFLHLEDTRARMLKSNVAAVLFLLLWLHFQFSQFPRRICMSWDVEVNGDCRLKNGDSRLWDRRLIIIELTTGLSKSNSKNSNNNSCCRCACNAAAVDLNPCCCYFCFCCCRVSCRNSKLHTEFDLFFSLSSDCFFSSIQVACCFCVAVSCCSCSALVLLLLLCHFMLHSWLRSLNIACFIDCAQFSSWWGVSHAINVARITAASFDHGNFPSSCSSSSN